MVEISILNKAHLSNFIDLLKVFEITFEMEDFEIPEEKYLIELLSKPDFFVFIAKEDGRVIGGLTMYVLHQYYSEKPLAYLYDLAILPEKQRLGIGKRLLNELSEFCFNKGFEEIYVQALKDEEQAVNFYRSTSFHKEDEVLQFTYLKNHPAKRK